MAGNQTMEDRLKALVEANKPENRNKWALEWKKQGKKVMGLLCTYMPEEILSAAEIFPWRITGTWREAAPLAAAHRPEMTCRYCSHVLESALTGELDFLDGVATTQVDDDFKRLWDVLHYLQKPAFSYIMYLPHTSSKTTFRMWTKSVMDLKKAVEGWTGKEIEEENLHHQIDVYNKMRNLLLKVYELRKKEIPSVTGAEALGITTAARVMPKDEFNKELEALLPYLENRQGVFKRTKPRLLMSGEYLDHPGYVEIVESSGAAVVMDDFDTGAKYFWRNVNDSMENPWQSLADRYMNRPGTARMANWNEQAEQVVKWLKEFNADGVVELRQIYSLPLDYRFFIIKKKFEAANIPYISLSREYHLANVGMLRTRVEAFIEMIQGKGK
jgi:benzoyl-CoA reductase/2-hydroxyglutaryl-CoA dehydratase subunit BcrC/BadD/HgdB